MVVIVVTVVVEDRLGRVFPYFNCVVRSSSRGFSIVWFSMQYAAEYAVGSKNVEER